MRGSEAPVPMEASLLALRDGRPFVGFVRHVNVELVHCVPDTHVTLRANSN